MYAIIRTGGKQYKVAQGECLQVETLPVEVNGTVEFDEVLAVCDGDNVQFGNPVVASAKVTGKVVDQGRGPKIIVFKSKRRGGHRCKKGHRQNYTEVRIESISVGN
jgi:large subunit ribosomal protein L21